MSFVFLMLSECSGVSKKKTCMAEVEPTLLTPRGRGLGGDRSTDFIHDSLQLGYGLVTHGPPFQQLLPSLNVTLRNQTVFKSENQKQMAWSFMSDKQNPKDSLFVQNYASRLMSSHQISPTCEQSVF